MAILGLDYLRKTFWVMRYDSLEFDFLMKTFGVMEGSIFGDKVILEDFLELYQNDYEE